MRINNTPKEDVEQEQLFMWAAWSSGKYPELKLMHHIPNGGGRSKAEAGKLKATGVKAGVPDIFLPCARGGYHGLYIEMKRVKGGRLSPEQREMILLLEKQGYKVAVCRGMEMARDVIIKYLEG